MFGKNNNDLFVWFSDISKKMIKLQEAINDLSVQVKETKIQQAEILELLKTKLCDPIQHNNESSALNKEYTGIVKNTQGENKITFTCDRCGNTTFIQKRDAQDRFNHANRLYICKKCGTTNWPYTEYMRNGFAKCSQVDHCHIKQTPPDFIKTDITKYSFPEKTYNNVKLNKEQSMVIDLLENTNDNYFVTGKAGTGKSTVLNYFKEHTAKKVVVLAPTGLAATSVGGQTIHSFFNLAYTQDTNNPNEIAKGIGPAQIELMSSLDVIVIDEISMVRADIMDMIDNKLRYARKNQNPYGGCQMIVFGDLFQLPPVVKEGEREFLENRYTTSYFFGAPAAQYAFNAIELQTVFRQSDPFFIEVLNHIREGSMTTSELQKLKDASGSAFRKDRAITLVPTKSAADIINNRRLNEINSDTYTYIATKTGELKQDEFPCVHTLKLKQGANVIMLSNDPAGRYRNGTLATISRLEHDAIYISIQNGMPFKLEPYTWSQYKYIYNKNENKIEKEEIGTIQQFPVKLSYAITIHKSQGQTFDYVVVDYSQSGAFSTGQTYVALSRCKKLSNMLLPAPIELKDIKVDKTVVEYMKTATIPAINYCEASIAQQE